MQQTLEEMHRDHVPADRIPPNFQLLGATSRSGNQGMVLFLPDSTDSLPTPASTPPLPSSEAPDAAPDTFESASANPDAFEATTDSPPQRPELDRALLSRIQVITIQGHPEWNEKVLTPLITERAANGVFEQTLADDAMRRRFWRNDGVSVFGSVMWTMLGV